MAQIGMIRFALRHFNNPAFAGTKMVGMTPEELVELANKALAEGAELQDGYAPFCKHLFIRNPTETKAGVAPITPENEHLLHTDYEARRADELPVLKRWFRGFEGLRAPRAEWLDIILYSRAQLEEEEMGTPEAERDLPPADCAWGIVSINGELQAEETPMDPITMMRNALGKEEGGSGVPLDREKYRKSVAFWKEHATVR